MVDRPRTSADFGVRALAVTGFCVASYALYVELSLENDPSYEPLCDLRPYVRCSPAFISPYAKGFGIVEYLFGKNASFNVPNGFVGMVFYAVSFALSFSDNCRIANVHYYLMIVSNLMTVYLAFVLVFVVGELCLVCLATYLINLAGLLCLKSIRRFAQCKSKDD